MSSVGSARDAAAVWDIATPLRPAGCRGSAWPGSAPAPATSSISSRSRIPRSRWSSTSAKRCSSSTRRFVWAQLVTSRGQVRVDQLAAEIGWSRKRLWSRFRSQIGLTPKRAAQLVRFDHAAHLLAAGHSAARVAAETGYADQSHLHRDVMAFAGVTPTAVAVAPWLAVDDVAWATPEHVYKT
jgi:AraC-like DNA-binding protein